ncbi:hypothetical protein [Streptomyces physcomitrii]|nr:hypothetical protein [Streptomyces physcomitrii]
MGDDATVSVASPPASPFGKIRTTLFTAEFGVLATPYVSGDAIPYVEPAAPYALGAMAVTVAWPHITWLARLTARGCGVLCGKAVDTVLKGVQNRWDKVRDEKRPEEKDDKTPADGPDAQASGPQDRGHLPVSAPETPAAAPPRPLYGIPQQTAPTETPVGSLPTGGADEE